MAGKKKASKKVAAKNVDHKKDGNVETEVMVDAPDEEAEPAPAPAIQNEPIMKVVEQGQAKYYTKTEYDKKYGKKAK